MVSRHDVARELHHYIDDASPYQTILARLDTSPELVRLAKGKAGEPARYCTCDMVMVQAQMLESAENLAKASTYPVSLHRQQAVMAQHSHLSDEQRAAVQHLTECGNLAGVAGAGKSSTLQAACERW